jgi:hypothetical protein
MQPQQPRQITIGKHIVHEVSFELMIHWSKLTLENYMEYVLNSGSTKLSCIYLQLSGQLDTQLIGSSNPGIPYYTSVESGLNGTNHLLINPSTLGILDPFEHNGLKLSVLSNWTALDPDHTFHISFLAVPTICLSQDNLSLP